MLRSLLAMLVCGLAVTAGETRDRPAGEKLSGDEKALVDLLNRERAGRKLAPLKVNPLLCRAARAHSENMARQEKVVRVVDGKRVVDQVEAAGYAASAVTSHLTAIGTESIDPPDIHKRWLKDRAARDDILDPMFTEVGVALARGKNGTWYYTQVLASPRKDRNPADDEKALVELLNRERARHKLAVLKVNPLLCRAARAHSENMARQEKMAHVLDGKRPGDRVAAAGYDYQRVRENLAVSLVEPGRPPSAPEDIHKDWMNSKGHRANILDARVTEVGISMVRSKKGNWYYTQVFASPSKDRP